MRRIHRARRRGPRTPLLMAAAGALLLAAGCPPANHRCPRPRPAEPRAGGPARLLLESTPPIPAALRARIRQYTSTRPAAFQALSDDGRQMLITTRFGQTTQVHHLAAPRGPRTQLTFRAEPVSSASFAPGDPQTLVYRSDVGGDEKYQLWRLDLRTGRTVRLTDGKSRHGSYRWSPDGKQLVFTSNARNGRDMDLYLCDGRTPGSAKLLLKRRGAWYLADWSRDGQRLLLMNYRSINDSRLHVLHLGTKQVSLITPKTLQAAYRATRFAHGGTRIYVATDRNEENVTLYEMDLASGTWTPLTKKIHWNVERLALSPDGKTLVFAVNANGWSHLYRMSTADRKITRLAGLPRGIVRRMAFARKAPVLGLTLRTATGPSDAYAVDLRTGRTQRWTRGEVGGLNPTRFVAPRLIHYNTFDDRRIPAFLYKPRGKGPHPVVVWIHGGPESQARPQFHPLIQYLVNESRVAVLMPNVRGSDGYGKSYLLLDNGFKREDSVKDIGALLDWIGTRPGLDPKRMAVFGGSYGGYMVLASLIRYGARLRAGVDVVGISNFVTFLRNTRSYRRHLRRAEYGDERQPAMREFLQRISPTTHAARIRSALFVAQGANDPRVPLSESDQMVKAVRARGQEVWYMVARDEGHGFRKKRNRALFYALTALFLEKHLRRP